MVYAVILRRNEAQGPKQLTLTTKSPKLFYFGGEEEQTQDESPSTTHHDVSLSTGGPSRTVI